MNKLIVSKVIYLYFENAAIMNDFYWNNQKKKSLEYI